MEKGKLDLYQHQNPLSNLFNDRGPANIIRLNYKWISTESLYIRLNLS